MTKPLLNHKWFGPYFLELTKYFKSIYKDFLVTDDSDPLNPQVLYGTPYAAYRKSFDQENQKMILPVINFYLMESERQPSKEPVRKDLFLYSPGNDNTILKTRPPMHYKNTYQFYMWCNNLRERDAMMHRLSEAFPRNEISLLHRPYPDYDPTDYLFMPFKIEGNFSDETVVDGLDPKETRDKIIMTWTIQGESILPYEVFQENVIKTIYVDINDAVDVEEYTFSV